MTAACSSPAPTPAAPTRRRSTPRGPCCAAGPVECDDGTDLDAALDGWATGCWSWPAATAASTWRSRRWPARPARRRPVGLVPLGTGNDLAGALGLPADPGEAAALVATGRPGPLDLLSDASGDRRQRRAPRRRAPAADAAARLKPPSARRPTRSAPPAPGCARTGWPLHVELDGRVLADGPDACSWSASATAPGSAAARRCCRSAARRRPAGRGRVYRDRPVRAGRGTARRCGGRPPGATRVRRRAGGSVTVRARRSGSTPTASSATRSPSAPGGSSPGAWSLVRPAG